MSVTTLVALSMPEAIASLFLDETRPDSAAVLPLAVSFLFLAAFFQIADGLQAVAAGALRGLNDTVVPMFIAALSYWGVGLAVGVGLAFGAGMGGAGLWLGFVAGLVCAAVLLTQRFRSLARFSYLPALAPA
jgi:MATE family multidrug resistance protein